MFFKKRGTTGEKPKSRGRGLKPAEWSPSGVIQLNRKGLARILPEDIEEAKTAIRELRLQRQMLAQARRQTNETLRQARQDIREEERRRGLKFDPASVDKRLRSGEDLKRSVTVQIDEIDRVIVELQLEIERLKVANK